MCTPEPTKDVTKDVEEAEATTSISITENYPNPSPRCPKCDYCPSCGRSKWPTYNARWYTPVYPNTVITGITYTTGTSSIGISTPGAS